MVCTVPRIVPGQRSWSMSRDEEGHRNYTIVFLIEAGIHDGPYVVSNTPGLPTPCSLWQYDNDVDHWAFCHPEAEFKIHQEKEGEPNRWWTGTFHYSTKPLPSYDTQVVDPLFREPKVTGTFVKYTRQGLFDKNGRRILTSSYEQVKGPNNEWDGNRPTVKIEQYVANLQFDTLCDYMDAVNDAVLWGHNARCVKLSACEWQRAFIATSVGTGTGTGARSCFNYYIRTLEFDMNRETFDRDIADVGTKVLRGHWDDTTKTWVYDADITGTSYLDPQNFVRAQDARGNLMRLQLNGRGRMATTETGTSDTVIGSIPNSPIKFYKERNFTTLGIPTNWYQ